MKRRKILAISIAFITGNAKMMSRRWLSPTRLQAVPVLEHGLGEQRLLYLKCRHIIEIAGML